MADIEINDNKSEKDGHCEQEIIQVYINWTREQLFVTFAELRSSKARFESCVGKHLCSSL